MTDETQVQDAATEAAPAEPVAPPAEPPAQAETPAPAVDAPAAPAAPVVEAAPVAESTEPLEDYAAELAREQKIAAAAVEAAKAGDLPASVKLAAPYGYIDDDGVTAHYWQAGETVTDKDQVAILVGRRAPLE